MVKLTPNPGILDIAPYKAGGFLPENSKVWGLASNENLLGPSQQTLAAYQKAYTRLNRYPDQGAVALKKAIADLHNVSAENILLGNGSDEILSLLFRAYVGIDEEVILSENGFFLFPILTKAQGAKVVLAKENNLTTQIDAILENITPKTRIICIANPNNPTGTFVPLVELKRLCETVPANVLIIIDAAYAEYMVEGEYGTGSTLVDQYPNVVMTRTLSKIYGLAALRVGWAYASTDIIAIINRIRLAFHVNSVAQEVSIAALADQMFVQKCVAHNLYWRNWFEKELDQFGLEYQKTYTNFSLLLFKENLGMTAQDLQEYLLDRQILTRALKLPGLSGSCLRITIGPEQAMEELVLRLKEFFHESKKVLSN
jgi:histidinol-phosphate aminotransferase